MMNSGSEKIFYEVLDEKRVKILENLSKLKDRFYLAGGTALALLIGHRISVDFDFFTFSYEVDERLINELHIIFHSHNLTIVQQELDTLSVLIDDEIKLSFFKLGYPGLFNLIETQYFKAARVEEIGIMKLVALPRASYKDYLDLYFILHRIDLNSLLLAAEKKHPDFDTTIYLKALLSFDDVDFMPIQFISGNEVSRDDVFEYIEKVATEYIRQIKA